MIDLRPVCGDRGSGIAQFALGQKDLDGRALHPHGNGAEDTVDGEVLVRGVHPTILVEIPTTQRRLRGSDRTALAEWAAEKT
jgi:hypothetical protein